MLPAGFLLKCPLTRNANSVFRRKGGESPNGKGGAQSRTGGAGGLPGCTSEALRARKLGRDRSSRRRASFTARGILPPFFLRERARGGGSRPAGPQRSGARKHAVARMATRPEQPKEGLAGGIPPEAKYGGYGGTLPIRTVAQLDGHAASDREPFPRMGRMTAKLPLKSDPCINYIENVNAYTRRKKAGNYFAG